MKFKLNFYYSNVDNNQFLILKCYKLSFLHHNYVHNSITKAKIKIHYVNYSRWNKIKSRSSSSLKIRATMCIQCTFTNIVYAKIILISRPSYGYLTYTYDIDKILQRTPNKGASNPTASVVLQNWAFRPRNRNSALETANFAETKEFRVRLMARGYESLRTPHVHAHRRAKALSGLGLRFARRVSAIIMTHGLRVTLIRRQ